MAKFIITLDSLDGTKAIVADNIDIEQIAETLYLVSFELMQSDIVGLTISKKLSLKALFKITDKLNNQ